MTELPSISDHWATGDVHDQIVKAMQAASISPAPVPA